MRRKIGSLIAKSKTKSSVPRFPPINVINVFFIQDAPPHDLIRLGVTQGRARITINGVGAGQSHSDTQQQQQQHGGIIWGLLGNKQIMTKIMYRT